MNSLIKHNLKFNHGPQNEIQIKTFGKWIANLVAITYTARKSQNNTKSQKGIAHTYMRKKHQRLRRYRSRGATATSFSCCCSSSSGRQSRFNIVISITFDCVLFFHLLLVLFSDFLLIHLSVFTPQNAIQPNNHKC